MSSDVRTRLRDLADAMPAAPGDLEAVQHRARQRGRHARAAVVAGAAVLVLVAVAVWRLPMQPPPVIGEDQPSTLHLGLCHPQVCPESPATLEEVLATLRDDPAVMDIEVIDVETLRRRAAEAMDMPLDELPAEMIEPSVKAVVQPSGDEDLAMVAHRLQEAMPGVAVRRGGALPRVDGAASLEPGAAIGRAYDVVEVTVGGGTVTARMWPVEDGGRCIGVADLVSCDVDDLLTRGGTTSGEAWGRPAPGVTCAWSPVGDEVTRISASFANGEQADGEVGDPPPGVLAGAGLVCVDARTHPTAIEYVRANGRSSSSGMAPWTEVRPPDVPGWRDVSQMVSDQLTDDRVESLAAITDPDARREAIAATITDLDRPGGIEEVTVHDTAIGLYRPGDDGPSTQVAAQVTTTRGDPICMVVLVYDADDPRPRPMLLLDRPVVWTPEDGCPPLS